MGWWFVDKVSASRRRSIGCGLGKGFRLPLDWVRGRAAWATSCPPYGFQAAIRADAPSQAEASQFLNDIRDCIAPTLPDNVHQFGAVPMQMARLAERERAQVFLESPSRKALHHALNQWEQVLNQYKSGSIRWHIDVDTQEI